MYGKVFVAPLRTIMKLRQLLESTPSRTVEKLKKILNTLRVANKEIDIVMLLARH